MGSCVEVVEREEHKTGALLSSERVVETLGAMWCLGTGEGLDGVVSRYAGVMYEEVMMVSNEAC